MFKSEGVVDLFIVNELCSKDVPIFFKLIIEVTTFKDNFEDGKVTNEVLDMGIEDVLTTFAHQIEE